MPQEILFHKYAINAILNLKKVIGYTEKGQAVKKIGLRHII